MILGAAMQLVTDGIVLKEVKTGESDRILTILTRAEGLISASAKSSLRLKNKLSSATGLLCWSDFTFFNGKTMYSINEAQSKNVFFELRNDIEVLSIAMYLAELTSNLAAEEIQTEDCLELLIAAFKQLCKAKQLPILIKSAFELKLLSMTGYMPDLIACNDCGKYESDIFYFDISNGSLLCEDCIRKQHLTANITSPVLAAMRYIVFSDATKIYNFTLGKKNTAYLNGITDAFVQYHLDKPMKSHQFLSNLMQENPENL